MEGRSSADARRPASAEGARSASDDGSISPEVDVGLDRLYHELKQHQQYGGAPTGHIILRPGEDLATVVWGYCILFATFCFFVSSIYAILLSKIMPDTGNGALSIPFYPLFGVFSEFNCHYFGSL